MKKFRNYFRKVIAGVLAVAVTMGSLHFTGKTSIVNAAAGFDPGSVVMRLGVLSDLHFNYGQGSEEGLKGMVEKYAKAVGTLEQMAKNGGSSGLDVLMIAGDYTNKGVYTEAKIFADASAAVMTEINKDKDESGKTQFFMTYGNHDTEQTGNMSIANWENVLKTAGTAENSYNLMEGITFADDSEGVGAESGCYKYVKEVNGTKYYFFSIETETYDAPSNEFRTDVLEWLDAELAATSKDAYVYVISHAPIKESGVYGADPAYDDNAEWASAEGEYQQTRAGRTAWNLTKNDSGATISATSATSYGMYKVDGNINGILKKYPQVVYMSGHTHRTNVLESAIMSKDYTAITVSALTQGELAKGEYIDTPQTGKGYGLYIEVDAEGRQKITRVDLSDSDIVDVTVTGTYTADVEKNYGDLDAYVTDSVSITPKTSDTTLVTLPSWKMAAPDAEGTHLRKYSAAARNAEAGNPVFSENVTVTNIDIKNGLSFDFSFPAATVQSGHYIMHYEVTVKDAAGKNIGTKRMYGSWNKNVEDSYHISFTQDELGGTTGFSVSVTAYNEFGGSTTIYWDGNGDGTAAANDVKTANFMPAVGAYQENLFDGLTTEDVRAYVNTGGDNPSTKPSASANVWSTAIDEKGNVAFRYNSKDYTTECVPNGSYYQYYDQILYAMKDTFPASSFNRWDGFAWFAEQMGPAGLDKSETFVYATDFKLASGSTGVHFVFREPKASGNGNASNATNSGIYIASNVQLKLFNEEIASCTPAADYRDGQVHTMVILSGPDKVSVWIDDELLFDNVPYSMAKLAELEKAEKLENGNYKYTEGAIECSSAMYPVFAFFADKVDLTVSNQFLHVYDKTADFSGETAAMEDKGFNYFTTEGVTWTDTTKNEILADNSGFDIARTEAYWYTTMNKLGEGVFALDADAFETDDKVTLEFDITAYDTDTPCTLQAETSGYYIWRTSDNNKTQYYLKEEKWYTKSGSNYTETSIVSESEGDYYVDGIKLEKQIIIPNHQAEVIFRQNGSDDYVSLQLRTTETYMTYKSGSHQSMGKTNIIKEDGTLHVKIISTNEKVEVYLDDAYTSWNYSDKWTQAAADMKPAFTVKAQHGGYKFENVKITKESDVIRNATPLEENGSNNLLTGAEGQIVSSFVGNNAWEGKSDSKVNGNAFYTDLTKANLTNSGATDYTKEEVFWLFGSENKNLVIDGKESFVVSALVNVSNTQQEGQNNRVGLNVAAYDDTRVWYFIESTADTEGNVTSQLKVYHDNTECAVINISNQYVLRGYNRLTTLVSPFGYEIYLNGSSVFSEKLGNGSDADYSGLSFLASGVEAIFMDVSLHYNYENEYLYQEQLLEETEQYEKAVEGWYYEQKEAYDTEVAAIKAACENPADNQTLKNYLGVADAYRNEILTYGRAVNNPVQQGIATKTGTTAVLDATTGGSAGQHVAYLPVFDSAECPFTTEDTWILEADVTTSDTNADGSCRYWRFGLRLLSYGNAAVMLNGSEPHRWNPNVSGNWSKLAEDIGVNIATADALHFKFIITKDQSIQFIITTSDGSKSFKQTVDFADIGCDFKGRDFYPEFYGINGKYTLTNIRVMNAINDELMSAKTGTTVVVDALRSANAPTGNQEVDGKVISVSKFVPLFDAGAFPYTKEDTWTIEADVTSYTNGWTNYNRFGLQLAEHGGSNPTVMLNNGELYRNNNATGSPDWASISSNMSNMINIGIDGTYHFKFVITKNESIRIIVTSGDGATQYFDVMQSFTDMNLDLTGKDICPKLFGLNGTYTVSNLRISREADIITAGDPANNESRIPLSVAEGEDLPIGDIADGGNALYIAAWTDAEGKPVETYTSGAKVTATVIDKKMLNVKVQTRAYGEETTKRTVRFIASLNNVEGYAEGGFFLSTKSSEGLDFNGDCKKITEIKTAYTGLYANSVLYDTKEIYDDYSEYMFAYDIGGLPTGKTVYARAYVKLSDGTMILGAVREITID